tara:strand:- start:102 stop:503 length:402 start_codon:yes stop_codon:yes gene_type:complete
MLSLSMDTQCKITQALSVCGGTTESIFPQVEALLISESDYQEALEYVSVKKRMDRYGSLMDFLFCEIFIEYQTACFKFYNSKGPMLKDTITPEQLFRFNSILLTALEIAHGKFCDKRRINWTLFRCEVLRKVA